MHVIGSRVRTGASEEYTVVRIKRRQKCTPFKNRSSNHHLLRRDGPPALRHTHHIYHAARFCSPLQMHNGAET